MVRGVLKDDALFGLSMALFMELLIFVGSAVLSAGAYFNMTGTLFAYSAVFLLGVTVYRELFYYPSYFGVILLILLSALPGWPVRVGIRRTLYAVSWISVFSIMTTLSVQALGYVPRIMPW